ncbi:TRAF-like protein [Pseudocohnilembus persalinus]|uniref:TRAF-like protein n=1 Tax=Pseudocohnilembus persalinus TaxID=266149 RepID=A0A0V0QHZ7_PSEPJ|nr:TRAF-like protein [Pseudocohnilembus persalinus]|eukprot:KRX01881.1 TRAF-like protein [Pseudocohnilembus persalinus]
MSEHPVFKMKTLDELSSGGNYFSPKLLFNKRLLYKSAKPNTNDYINESYCPNCRNEQFDEKSNSLFLEDQQLQKQINSILFYCPNKKYGCKQQLNIHQIEEHEQKLCPQTRFNCTNKGCTEKLKKNLLMKHSKHCPYQLKSCKFCYFTKKLFLRKDLYEHETNQCEHRNIQCIQCQEIYSFNKTNHFCKKESINQNVQDTQIQTKNKIFVVQIDDEGNEEFKLQEPRQCEQINAIQQNEQKKIEISNDYQCQGLDDIMDLEFYLNNILKFQQKSDYEIIVNQSAINKKQKQQQKKGYKNKIQNKILIVRVYNQNLDLILHENKKQSENQLSAIIKFKKIENKVNN